MNYSQLCQLLLCIIVTKCSKKGTGHSETKHCPLCVVSWGYNFLEKKMVDEGETK